MYQMPLAMGTDDTETTGSNRSIRLVVCSIFHADGENLSGSMEYVDPVVQLGIFKSILVFDLHRKFTIPML